MAEARAVRTIGIDAADLLEAEIDTPEWLIPGYVTENSINVLAGPPNSGKTLLAFDWAAQLVARGKRVFIGENEGGIKGLQTRIRRACAAAGMEKLPKGQLMYERNMDVRLSDFGAVKAMAKGLEFFDLIILDSLSSFWPGLNENDSEHMSMVAESLKILCEFSRAAVVGNHHTTKAAWKMGEKPGLGDLRGHGAMAGRIDAAFICKPMEKAGGVVRFELHVVKQRDEDWTPPKACEVQMTGEAATLTAEPLPPSSRGRSMARPTDARERELEQQVMLVLPDNAEEALGQNLICTKVRRAKPDVVAAIKRLYYTGSIQQNWEGRYYRLKAPQPNENGAVKRYSPSAYRPYQPPEDD